MINCNYKNKCIVLIKGEINMDNNTNRLKENQSQTNKTQVDNNTQSYKELKEGIKQIQENVKILKLCSIISTLAILLIAIFWILYFFLII